jgi:CBS domain-containing protein
VARFAKERIMNSRSTVGVRIVEEIMTKDPVCIDGGTTARELARVLEESEISGVPVTDVQGRIIGVVSRTDLMNRCVEGPFGAGPGMALTSLADGLGGTVADEEMGVVEDFMNPDPITAPPDEPISAIAARMVRDHVHRIVIVDDENLVIGVVTTLDVLSVFPET